MAAQGPHKTKSGPVEAPLELPDKALMGPLKAPMGSPKSSDVAPNHLDGAP
jgi:hypothetical protein